MNDSIRERLLGYLLDALEDGERAEVERQLTCDPNWREELESLRANIEPLEAACEEYDPPPNLAEQTCSLVECLGEPSGETPYASSRARRMSPIAPVTVPWSLTDSVVAVGICLAAALLFFPAIYNSRYAAQMTACQNNLRQIGFALMDYSDKAGMGYFPAVPSDGNRAFAGIYAPILFEGGYLTDARVFVCPASPVRDMLDSFQLPSLIEIDTANAGSVARLQEQAGGTYGYNLGVIVSGVHVPPRNRGRVSFALMSDAPSPALTSEISVNHEGRGYNLLFEDGHVSFLETKDTLFSRDDPFRNRRGIVEAGLDENDAVIGRSLSPPFQHAGIRWDTVR